MTDVKKRKKGGGKLTRSEIVTVRLDPKLRYLSELAAYLHLNPVRTGMVVRPEEYPWSSHRAYLGGEAISWLHSEAVLSLFSTNLAQARCQFSEFVGERQADGHQDEFYGKGCMDNRLLGEDRFVETVLELSPRTKYTLLIGQFKT